MRSASGCAIAAGTSRGLETGSGVSTAAIAQPLAERYAPRGKTRQKQIEVLRRKIPLAELKNELRRFGLELTPEQARLILSDKLVKP